MSRQFFDQIDDELRGLLGPALRGFNSVRSGWLIKVWYGEPTPVHFEAQHIGPRWAPGKVPVIEVGLHLEHPTKDQNDALLNSIVGGKGWRRALPRAEAGRSIGPRAATWRRLSECIPAEGVGDSDFAGEIAEVLAVYIKTLRPVLDALDSEISRTSAPRRGSSPMPPPTRTASRPR